LIAVFVQGFEVIKDLEVSLTQTLPAHFLLLFLQAHEKFLGMASDLGARSRSDVLFNHPPVLVV